MEKNESIKPRDVVKRALLLSFGSAPLLTLISLLFKQQSSCCADCMCIAGSVTYRGFPLQYMTNNFGFYSDSLKGFIANLVIYLAISFIIFFIVLKVLCKKSEAGLTASNTMVP